MKSIIQLRKIFHNKIFWGLLAKIINLSSGLILIPLLVHYLSKEMMALYYLFISLAMLTWVLDFGFSSTITRAFTYAYAGASNIKVNGFCDEIGGGANWELIKELLFFSRKLYAYISILALFIFFVPGALYIYSIVKHTNLNVEYALFCWIVYSSASVITLYFVYLSALMQGRGDINVANQIIIISRVANIILTAVLVCCGFKLLAVSIATFSVCIIERLLYIYFIFNDRQHKELKLLSRLPPHVFRENFRLLGQNSLKSGVVALGAYLITRSTMFIAVNYLGLQIAASYILTIQVVFVIFSMANVVVTVYVPKMNSLVHVPLEQVQLFCFSNLLSLVLYIVAAIILICCGQILLSLLHANTVLINNKELLLLLIVYLLELQHSNYACLIATRNYIPYVGSAIYSGIAIVVLSVISMKFTQLGIWGLIIAQGIAQLAYNNWYWIYYICKFYSISYFDTFKLGISYARSK